ncbi:MAG TPA: helix-turn-helix domain-containing protein [Roseiflexaceae bacterium]|nr:helix-turn-helix domain-containing protein [Roseiflexaceae bacterium]
MFKIGDFSKFSRLPVKTLRYYDELGLLRPAHVDHFTGYRYYAIDQLPRLNRILALKDLGFSLDQIARLLDDALWSMQMREVLRMKQTELQQLVWEEQARLARVEARLRLIEQEEHMPEYDLVLKRIEAQTVALRRKVAPTFDDLHLFGREVHSALEQLRNVRRPALVQHQARSLGLGALVGIAIPSPTPTPDPCAASALGPRMRREELPDHICGIDIARGDPRRHR